MSQYIHEDLLKRIKELVDARTNPETPIILNEHPLKYNNGGDIGFEDFVYDDKNRNVPRQQQQQPEICLTSLGGIFKALTLKEYSLNFIQLLNYSIITITILVIVLYLFPKYIVTILLSLVLIVLCVISLVLRIPQIRKPREYSTFNSKPICPNRLQKLRDQLKKKQQTVEPSASDSKTQ